MNTMNMILGGLMVSGLLVGVAQAGNDDHFGAHMNGAQNVPVMETNAQAQLILKRAKDGTFDYKLIISGLEQVTVSHIHCALDGANGPAGVNLLKFDPAMGANGILEGAFAAPNAGNACGWVTNDDVAMAIQTGNAYVNVHTKSVPAGVVRGQIK